jgi:hypothetical protein
VKECAEWHDRRASEMRIDLPKFAYCSEFSYNFVVVLVGFGHVVLLLSGLALLLHHGPHLVLLRQRRVRG